jgi:hypothetical protein
MYQAFAAGADPRVFHDSLYAGSIALFRDLPEMTDIVELTRAFLEDRFAPHHPSEIHRHHLRAQLTEIFSSAQRDYGASEETTRAWRALFEAIGFDPTQFARDRVVLRFQPHTDPSEVTPWDRHATVDFHRDTWGTNLYAQVNWWAPVYPLSAGRTVALFPHLWDQPLSNNSSEFDIAETLRRIREAPGSIRAADMAPKLTDAVDSSIAQPVTIAPGSIIAFSAQHAHAAVPNHTGLTRISFDTRTLFIADHLAGRGAPNIDGHAQWMAPGLFRRLSDEKRLSDVIGCQFVERFAAAAHSPGPKL